MRAHLGESAREAPEFNSSDTRSRSVRAFVTQQHKPLSYLQLLGPLQVNDLSLRLEFLSRSSTLCLLLVIGAFNLSKSHCWL